MLPIKLIKFHIFNIEYGRVQGVDYLPLREVVEIKNCQRLCNIQFLSTVSK